MMDRLGPANLLVFLAMTPAASASQRPTTQALPVPVAGSGDGMTFAGTFQLQRFAAEHGSVVAIGELSGSASNAAGAVTSIGRTLSLRVAVVDVTCHNLHLDLEPLSLSPPLSLSRVALDLPTESGAADLLTAVVAVFDQPPALARLLNQILSALLG